MSIDPIFWLLAAVGFLALEGMTFSMVSVWFAAGSAAALLCCLFTHSFRVQAVVFIAVSAVCLLAFKPLAKRLHKQPTPTNGDRALGRHIKAIIYNRFFSVLPYKFYILNLKCFWLFQVADLYG